MKNRLAFLPSLLLVPLMAGLVPSAVQAQVSTNLDALPGAPVHSAHPVHRKARVSTPAPRHHTTQPPEPPTPAGYTRVPRVPKRAPSPVLITPPAFPVVLHPAVPAATVTAAADSHSHTEVLPKGGLRLISDQGSTGLNDGTITAIRHYAQTVAPKLNMRLVLHSYASLPGNDMSMPRRIALSRALAVRSLLVQEGVATTRIYPIAQGRPDSADTAPAERLDILPETNPAPSGASGKGTKVP